MSAPSAAKINHRKIKSPTPTTVEAAAPLAPTAEANLGSNGHELKAGEIAVLAYSYWEARGAQDGSAEEDWFRAEQELGAQ